MQIDMGRAVPSDSTFSRCDIRSVGKSRNGRPRYWCVAHKTDASGFSDEPPSACGSANQQPYGADCLDLDEASYLGGLALWGAVRPVYDTTGLPPERGIHVHARPSPDSDKEIDATYSAISVTHRSDLLSMTTTVIDDDAAVNYYLSKFAIGDVSAIPCPFCRQIHLDRDFFAVHSHRRHLCEHCGRYFFAKSSGVSNPIAVLRSQRKDTDASRSVIRPHRPLNINQNEYPGGIQIWASNPAFLWTAARSEEEGIHVHLYDKPGCCPVVDDTFSEVEIDGHLLDEQMVRYLMAQQSLGYLEGKIASLKCGSCNEYHFDKGELAFNPHRNHTCEHCMAEFQSPKIQLLISNPLVHKLLLLQTAIRSHINNNGVVR